MNNLENSYVECLNNLLFRIQIRQKTGLVHANELLGFA